MLLCLQLLTRSIQLRDFILIINPNYSVFSVGRKRRMNERRQEKVEVTMFCPDFVPRTLCSWTMGLVDASHWGQAMELQQFCGYMRFITWHHRALMSPCRGADWSSIFSKRVLAATVYDVINLTFAYDLFCFFWPLPISIPLATSCM